MNERVSGISLYWNDEQLSVEPYARQDKHYYCGRELLHFPELKTVMYRILVLDYDECCCAEVFSDGEIKIVFKATSDVPHKHKAGGQSAARFMRIRDEFIKQWFKQVNKWLISVREGGVVCGISPIYRSRFEHYLDTENLKKIARWENTEYTNLSGIYQMVKKLESEN